MQRIEAVDIPYSNYGISNLMFLVQTLNDDLNLPVEIKFSIMREALYRLNNDPHTDLLSLIPEYSSVPRESFQGSGTEIAEATPAPEEISFNNIQPSVPFMNDYGYMEIAHPVPGYAPTLFNTTQPQVTTVVEAEKLNRKLVPRPLNLKKERPQNKFQSAFSLIAETSDLENSNYGKEAKTRRKAPANFDNLSHHTRSKKPK